MSIIEVRSLPSRHLTKRLNLLTSKSQNAKLTKLGSAAELPIMTWPIGPRFVPYIQQNVLMNECQLTKQTAKVSEINKKGIFGMLSYQEYISAKMAAHITGDG